MKRFLLATLFAVAITAALLPVAVAQALPDGLATSSDEPRVMTSEEFAREILRDLPALAREHGVELSDFGETKKGKLRALLVSCIRREPLPRDAYRDESQMAEFQRKNHPEAIKIADFIESNASDRADVAVLSYGSERFSLRATSANLRAYLSMLVAAAEPNDDLLVVLLGNNGASREAEFVGDGGKGNAVEDYFIPDDATFQNTANWIGLEEITTALASSRARRVTILWDVPRTFSRMTPPKSSRVAESDSIDAVGRAGNAMGVKAPARVRRVFYACDAGKYPWRDDANGGDLAIQALFDEATSVDDLFGAALDASRYRAQRRLSEAKVEQTLTVEPF